MWCMSAATALDKSKMVSNMSLTTRRHFLDQFLDVSGQNITKAIAHYLQFNTLLWLCWTPAFFCILTTRRLTLDMYVGLCRLFASFQLVEGNSGSMQDAAVSNNCNDDVTNIQNYRQTIWRLQYACLLTTIFKYT